jgi:hypothetical protein
LLSSLEKLQQPATTNTATSNSHCNQLRQPQLTPATRDGNRKTATAPQSQSQNRNLHHITSTAPCNLHHIRNQYCKPATSHRKRKRNQQPVSRTATSTATAGATGNRNRNRDRNGNRNRNDITTTATSNINSNHQRRESSRRRATRYQHCQTSDSNSLPSNGHRNDITSTRQPPLQPHNQHCNRITATCNRNRRLSLPKTTRNCNRHHDNPQRASRNSNPQPATSNQQPAIRNPQPPFISPENHQGL